MMKLHSSLLDVFSTFLCFLIYAILHISLGEAVVYSLYTSAIKRSNSSAAPAFAFASLPTGPTLSSDSHVCPRKGYGNRVSSLLSVSLKDVLNTQRHNTVTARPEIAAFPLPQFGQFMFFHVHEFFSSLPYSSHSDRCGEVNPSVNCEPPRSLHRLPMKQLKRTPFCSTADKTCNESQQTHPSSQRLYSTTTYTRQQTSDRYDAVQTTVPTHRRLATFGDSGRKPTSFVCVSPVSISSFPTCSQSSSINFRNGSWRTGQLSLARSFEGAQRSWPCRVPLASHAAVDADVEGTPSLSETYQLRRTLPKSSERRTAGEVPPAKFDLIQYILDKKQVIERALEEVAPKEADHPM
eukprot:GHVQ01004691.1.p1 GENE.GHVQ01004691.1~~GHVQ01004691.1.p1  ORF type:complete len:351 (+),score=36.89 GHVQ01004691.1:153-1205(+)